ncbi:hypothetical protein PFISCL1PPCAC_18678, partial [Pristionchus fissidentatus]
FRLMNETCIDKSIQIYHKTHFGKFADFDSLIDIIMANCGDSVPAKSISNDFIYQLGKALVIVSRKGDVVTIKQTRFLSTYFEKSARDNRTRYTIPLLYTTNNGTFIKIFNKNESELKLTIPSNWRFTIDIHYHALFRPFYEDPFPISSIEDSKNETISSELAGHVRFSMVTGLETGLITIDRYFELIRANILESKVIGFNEMVFEGFINKKTLFIFQLIIQSELRKYMYLGAHPNEDLERIISWDDLFNNRTYYLNDTGIPTLQKLNGTIHAIECLTTWHNTTTYTRFLRDNFIDGNLRIRPDSIEYVQ